MEKPKKSKNPRSCRWKRFRGRQQSGSIFFLLWTVFSVLSVVVVVLFGVLQQSIFVQSYKGEASREISRKGEEIYRALLVDIPDTFNERDYNGYIQFLSRTYDVEICVLNADGRQIYPQNIKPGSPEYEEYYDRKEDKAELVKELAKEKENSVVYEGEKEYVFGAKIPFFDEGTETYLRVGKSLHLMETARTKMNVRTVLLGGFVFVLAFAVSSAVAGWLVNPITELTKKAHRLAEGDFDVDFHGNDYGRELVELAESLNFARDELSKTDRMQKELIANVSHDFKTPLTMIKGYASMIIEISGDNPEKRNKHAQIIVDEADRLATLVADVLDLSKIRAGIAQLEETEFNMSEYLREVLERFAYLKDSQGYQFELSIEEGLYTRADPMKIGQVLYNLIGNAVNYTGADKKVYVSLKREEGCFRFSVTDTGVGIKREELGEIWNRYYRSSEAHKRPVQGTGLGLSIVKTILERHNFVFGVESELGKGSTFYALFPLITQSETVDKEKK